MIRLRIFRICKDTDQLISQLRIDLANLKFKIDTIENFAALIKEYIFEEKE